MTGPIKRVKGVQIYRPIIYGNKAKPLGNKKDPTSDHTHEWTISVQGINGADISHFIKKVTFKLHDTYANPTRVCENPPYEVTETGWGEFEIQIRINFVSEANEKAQMFYHHLKIHPYGIEDPEGIVSSFQYEEVVFNEPMEAMYDILTSNGNVQVPKERSQGNQWAYRTELEEADRITTQLKEVQQKTEEYRHQLIALEKDAVVLEAK
ncbi:Protein AF-9 [Neolecta irregularis DAH-3]|uniref:Protein AF-9 homolog n=1 Tax=Neolecta irregularis (strain DAH-3) TaxID=1198029 RepID=A0A1U7LRY0_NEOID|nr:Protein AF-9 [Neolecta irregularis DAH-3]|eukprot:OLL25426.1 Protein AF-9 [Neolecta irregularis DAH-3]